MHWFQLINLFHLTPIFHISESCVNIILYTGYFRSTHLYHNTYQMDHMRIITQNVKRR